MEYVKNDSSGTDDDLPNPGIIRASKGLACSGIMAIASGPMSSDKDLRDMEFQVHCIEIEAYSAVLRAFIAQSNDLSWGKEELISELRKELRVSDVEHREILGKVHSDDSIKFLRESLKNAEAQLAAMNPPPLGPNSMGHVPCKKLKQGHMTVSASPQYLTFAQPSSTAVQLPAKHARDDQLGRKGTLFSPQSNGQALGPVNPNVQPNKVKARGSLIVQASKKGFVHSGVDILKPGSDIIEILATDKLIHEVERVCGGENPEPALVQRAKLILKDHERALLEAIGKLADVSDGDDSPDRIQYMIQEPQSRAHVFPNNRSRSHCK